MNLLIGQPNLQKLMGKLQDRQLWQIFVIMPNPENTQSTFRICNHNKSDFLMKAENQNLLHPDCEGIRNAFFRDEMYYIRVADGQPSEVKDFYRKLGLDRQSCRLDYLLLNMKGLYEKTTDRQDVHDLLGKAILLLYEKRNNCC